MKPCEHGHITPPECLACVVAENERYRQALVFYASCPTLTSHDAASYDSASWQSDKGKIAREALKPKGVPHDAKPPESAA